MYFNNNQGALRVVMHTRTVCSLNVRKYSVFVCILNGCDLYFLKTWVKLLTEASISG